MLYADQSEVGLYPPVGAQWDPRGRQHKIRTHGRNQKVYLFGALEAHCEKLYVGCWPRKDSPAFVEFLQALLAALPPGPIYLILDNYGVHKSKRTREFLAGEGKRIHLVFLPTYAPWLNRIEITWRLVKAQAGTNAWRDTLEQLTADYQATLLAWEAQLLHPIPCFLSE